MESTTNNAQQHVHVQPEEEVALMENAFRRKIHLYVKATSKLRSDMKVLACLSSKRGRALLEDFEEDDGRRFRSETKVSDEVGQVFCERIVALLKEFPQLAKESFEGQYGPMLPFSMLISFSPVATLEAIRQVCELYPEAMSTNGSDPLKLAIKCDASDEVIQFVIPKNSHQAPSKSTMDLFWNLRPKSLKTIQLLEQYFGEVKSDTNTLGTALKNHGWSADVLKYLADTLPPEHLVLDHTVRYDHSRIKDNYVSRVQILLPSLREVDFLFEGPLFMQQFLALFKNENVTLLEKIKFRPRIKSLGNGSPPLDITETVKSILSQNKNLRSIIFGESYRFAFDWKCLVEIFKTNKTLKIVRFDICEQAEDVDLTPLAEIIEKHNTTLVEVRLSFHSPWGCPFRAEGHDEIDYWVRLNKFGRGFLQDSKKATRQKLVNTFIKVQRANQRRNMALSDNDVLNTFYGLLRESPGLWSGVGTDSSRKRKRNV